MKKAFLCFAVLLLLPLYLLDAQQDQLLQTQQSLSYAVRRSLEESRISMLESQRRYEAMIASLERLTQQQSEELMTLSTHLTDTMNSFQDSLRTIERLNENSVRLEERLRIRNSILRIAGILFVLNVIAKIVMFALYKKGVRVPRVLDIWI